MQQLEQEQDWNANGQQQNNFIRPLSEYINAYAPITNPFAYHSMGQVPDKAKYNPHTGYHAPPGHHADPRYHHYATPITEYTTIHHAPAKTEHFGAHPVHQDYTVYDEPGYDKYAAK